MTRLLVVVAVLLGACATPPTRPAVLARGDFDAVGAWIDARVDHERQAKKADAVAVVVVGPDGPLYSRVWSDSGAVTLDSRFRIGSISKLLSSLTTLALRDEGKLELDAPISAVLPWFQVHSRFDDDDDDDDGITARQLMTHKSGLPSTALRGMYGSTLTSLSDQTRHVASLWVARPPGTAFLYSDLGYTVLGAVIEAASGQAFADVADSRVFQPLGMSRTSFVPTKDVIPAVVHGAAFVENPPITLPANGAVSTPRDLARLAQHLLRASPTDPLTRNLSEAMSPQPTTTIDVDWRTGFGINENAAWSSDVGKVYWHSGQTPAFTAELVVCPAAGVGVVVMTNTHEAGFLPSVIGWKVLAVALQAATGARVEHAEPQEATGSPVFTSAELDSFSGLYPTEYGAISVHREGDRLVGRAFEETLELRPTSTRTFVPWILGFGVLPVRPDLLRGIELSFGDVDDSVTGRRRALFSHQRGLAILRGVKIDPTPPSSSWLGRVGHWNNPARGDDQITIESADVVVEAGFLLLKVNVSRQARPLVIPLQILNDDVAITAGIGRFLGETVTVSRDDDDDDDDDDDVLNVLGYPLRR